VHRHQSADNKEIVMKIVFLFGAGASKGAEEANIITPPLGVSLFKELQIRYPDSWGKMNQDSFSDDFEKGMSKLIKDQPAKINQLQRDMAAFFFEFQPTEDNLYLKMVLKIKPFLKNISFITLNYDQILMRCLRKASINYHFDISPQVEQSKLEICFPHGCSHLWLDSFRGPPGSITYDPRLDAINGPVRAQDESEAFNDQITNNPLSPVISCFDIFKTTLTAKEFIQRQRDRTEQLIHNADLVLIIGVGVRKHDEHIWTPLGKTSAKLFYCSGSGGAEFEAWAKESRIRSDEVIYPGYFSDHFDDIINTVNDTFHRELSISYQPLI
jgi:hypothetical protein